MLWSALIMSKMTIDADLNTWETITFGGGMSVYSGWLSSATILTVSSMLKMTGISNGWDEELWTVIMLWVAAFIYMGNSFMDENSIYPSVFVWALLGIKAANEDSMVEANLNILIGMMATYVVSTFFLFE